MNYPACAKTPFKPAYRITLPGRDDGQIFLIQPSCTAPFFTHPNRRVSNLRKNSRKKKLAIILHLVYYNKCAHEVSTDNLRHGPLAQLAEHLTLNQGVQGSIPWWSTIKKADSHRICAVAIFIWPPKVRCLWPLFDPLNKNYSPPFTTML